uniref:glycoside hydrolase family 13 protein n=1 Tax=Cellulomonas marina TaxID=988821 RepID=UPI001586F8FE|nr:glycoside hydrolase family 13 protein [Cellulomonas marina]
MPGAVVSDDLVHAPDAPGGPWWRHAVIYQVYPRSFADLSGDGIGDLPGITAHLDHLVELGVDAVWLSPFYRSPQKDAGYDVADYRDVDPLFGTLADADALVARAHELGLRVVVDLVPNHTSADHAWFQEALAAPPGSPARDRYLFRDGRGPGGDEPPNNWSSIFGGRAWTRTTDPDGTPGQWYLHLFDVSQPDLDWSNPVVREEFEDVLRFWLDRGVDGFRIDVAHGLVKAEGLPDWAGHVRMVEGAEDDPVAAADGAAEAHPNPIFDQDGVHEVYRSWRRVLDAYDGDRAMVAEAWVEPLSRLALYVRPDELQTAFNFAFLVAGWDAGALRRVVEASFGANDAVGAPTTWVLSNHDVVRHTSRFGMPDPTERPNGIGPDDVQPDAELGLRRARAATLVLLGLPGSAYLYQGEELGLPDHTALDPAVRQDPAFFRTGGEELGRDGCRVPLPWSVEAPAAGFSPTGLSWLPQPEGWGGYAAEAQRGVEGSTFEMYRAALRVRRELRLGEGGLRWAEVGPQAVTAAGVSASGGAGAGAGGGGGGGGDERAHGIATEHGEDRDPASRTGVLAFVNGDVLVVANVGADPVALPAGAEVLVASGGLGTEGDHLVVPTDTTAWVRVGA